MIYLLNYLITKTIWSLDMRATWKKPHNSYKNDTKSFTKNIFSYKTLFLKKTHNSYKNDT